MSPGGEGGAPEGDPRLRLHWLLICAAALLMMAPELFAGLGLSDSLRYNIVWTDQFTDLFRSGELYPRWLPRSWDGLGSPTFYFYPPLFFWVGGALDALSLGRLEGAAVVSLSSAVVLAASGLAMRTWLAEQAAARAALIGALAYMAMPYHLYDIYGRGALAEATAYAFLPLIALSVWRMARGNAGYISLLAVSYGGLILSHLPTALLASLFLIPAYTFFAALHSERPLLVITRALAGGILGLGIAAAYLLPALSLTGHVSASALFGPFYDPANWFFWRPRAWPRGGPMLLIVPVTLTLLSLAAASAWHVRHGRNREALFWAGITFAAVIMVSGALPFLWRLPFLSQVQFPFRMLVIGEFALVTCLAISRPRLRSPLTFLGAVPAAVAISTAAGMIQFQTKEAGKSLVKAAEIRAGYRDAPEYLPAGRPIAINAEGAPDAEKIVLPKLSLAQASIPSAQVAATERRDGGMDIALTSPSATVVSVRRFYFPHWKVTTGSGSTAVTRASPEQLLSWQAPAGRSHYRVSAGAAPTEALGLWISIGSLLLTLVTAILLFRRQMRHGVKDIFTFRD